MGLFSSHKSEMVQPERALPGRQEAISVTAADLVLGTTLTPPFPEGDEQAIFGMGCFWGAERKFWTLPGVYTTAVGYAGGTTPNPTYQEVCSGRTGHAEVVLVVFDPKVTTYETLLGVFFEGHNPTQGMRQGNDVGTQYRSAIFTTTVAQAEIALSWPTGSGSHLPTPGSARSRLRSHLRAPSITPSRTTSSTSRRILGVTAASGARACPALWASPAWDEHWGTAGPPCRDQLRPTESAPYRKAGNRSSAASASATKRRTSSAAGTISRWPRRPDLRGSTLCRCRLRR